MATLNKEYVVFNPVDSTLADLDSETVEVIARDGTYPGDAISCTAGSGADYRFIPASDLDTTKSYYVYVGGNKVGWFNGWDARNNFMGESVYGVLNLTVAGNTTIGGTLGVTGVTTLTGGATVPSGQTLTAETIQAVDGDGVTIKDDGGTTNVQFLDGGDSDFSGNYAVDLQNISDLGGSKASYNFDGVDEYIQVADNAAIQNIFDGGGSISAWIYPRSDGENGIGAIVSKNGSNYWHFSVFDESGGYVKLIFYHSFSTTGGQWITTDRVVPINAWSCIVVEYDNSSLSNNSVFYVNATSPNITESASPVGTRRSDAGIDLYIGNRADGTQTFDGLIAGVRLHNHALTAAEVKALYSGAETPYKYAGASQTPVYSSNFTAGADSWTAVTGCAVAGNIDGIDGVDDVLRISVDGSTGLHYAQRLSVLSPGKKYRLTFKYNIPSGQSNVDGIRLVDGYGIATYINAANTVGAWTDYELVFVASNSGSSSANIRWYALDGGTPTFTDTGADDVFYLKDIVIKALGEVATYRPQDATPTTWYDASGNGNDGTVSGATLINAHDTGYFESGVVIGSDSKNLSGQITLIASDNDQMTIAANTSDQMAFAGASGGYTFSDGNVGINNTAPLTKVHQAQFSADAVGSYHTFSKSRHATAGSHTVVQDNDVIGGINFAPSDGTDFGTIAAQIKSSVDDASPAASSIGGDLIFSTAKGAGADDLTLALTITKDQYAVFNSRVQGLKGSDVASANDITLGNGNYFDITGTTQINRILGTGWQAGSIVTLQFDASVTVAHGVAAGSGYYGLYLAGAGNFSATANDTLMVVFDGAWWREISRTVI